MKAPVCTERLLSSFKGVARASAARRIRACMRACTPTLQGLRMRSSARSKPARQPAEQQPEARVAELKRADNVAVVH